MHLTIGDWSRFLRLFLVDGDDSVLTPSSVERLIAVEPGRRQAMGWAPGQGVDSGVSVGQQGSNANWVATALLDRERRGAAMVVVNDGRTSLMLRTAGLAAAFLKDA